MHRGKPKCIWEQTILKSYLNGQHHFDFCGLTFDTNKTALLLSMKTIKHLPIEKLCF
ncbi:MAG: hypothetical protein JWP45_783 [Mucilaginibacter sp.]|nr:hypothetical protein [Mucilaginibacter sp.]